MRTLLSQLVHAFVLKGLILCCKGVYAHGVDLFPKKSVCSVQCGVKNARVMVLSVRNLVGNFTFW